MFALLVPSGCDKSATTRSCFSVPWYQVDDGNRLATSCARLTKAVHDLVVVINLLRAADIRLVVEQFVVSLLPSINLVTR